MPSEPERLAALEEWRQGVREDLGELVAETARTRRRLHNLEGVAQAFADAQKVAREAEARQYRRLTLALGFLGVVVAIAAIIVPLVLASHIGK